MMLRRLSPFLFLFLLPLAGCQIFGNLDGDDTAEKTYPGAGDLPLVSVQALKTTAPVPGSYNVHAYVTDIFVCPPEYKCVVGDRIVIADLPKRHDHTKAITLDAYPARQFELGAHYLMSIATDTSGGFYPLTGERVRIFRLLGYDRIP